MAEDQSVVGRRRIYYDQHGSEALICSDSEEELTEPEEEKHEFSEAEDRVLWYVKMEMIELLVKGPFLCEERFKKTRIIDLGSNF